MTTNILNRGVEVRDKKNRQTIEDFKTRIVPVKANVFAFRQHF